MKSTGQYMAILIAIALLWLSAGNISAHQSNTLTESLKDKNGNIMRGTPMVLGKHLGGSVAFALDIKNWENIKNNGYNTIRVCWVDPWYKDHNRTYWQVSEELPYLDKCVKNANKSGLIINFHGVGSQQEFNTTYTFAFEKEFWEAVAPRYKDNDLVYYENANEPTLDMDDYLKPTFKKNLLEIYSSIKTAAPDRHIMMFSFNTIIGKIVDVVEDYKSEIDWNTTSVAYHIYNYNSSEYIVNLMAYHRVICTEWNYNHVAISGDFGYIKQVDGFKENSQTLENIGSGWIDWRDWDDTTLNKLLDTLHLDAISKNYWWEEPVASLKVSGLHISNFEIELKTGQTRKISAWVLPALAENQEIKWNSSDNNIATINENGLITAIATQNKTTRITAASVDGNFKPVKIENIALKQGDQVMRIYFDFADYNMGTISISAINPTATNDLQSNDLVKVNQNPASDKLFISSQKPVEKYTIQTITEQTILQGSMLGKQYVDLKSLLKGAYLVCLMGNGFNNTSKFIKL